MTQTDRESETARDDAKAARPRGRRRMPSRSSRGTLAVVVVLLVASAGLRLTENWGAALALASDLAQGPGDAAPEDPDPLPDFDAVLAALAEREARIAEREAALDLRAEAIALAEGRLDEKLAQLTAAEEELRATIALSQTAAEDDLSQLTSVYENMGAEEAAALFAQMTPEFAAGFLGRMRPDIAAAILAGLEPGTAYEISVILAGRNALAPTE